MNRVKLLTCLLQLKFRSLLFVTIVSLALIVLLFPFCLFSIFSFFIYYFIFCERLIEASLLNVVGCSFYVVYVASYSYTIHFVGFLYVIFFFIFFSSTLQYLSYVCPVTINLFYYVPHQTMLLSPTTSVCLPSLVLLCFVSPTLFLRTAYI